MNKEGILKIIKEKTGIWHGAPAFKIACDFAKDRRNEDETGSINWDMVENVIDRNDEEFKTWIAEDAPLKFEDLIKDQEPAPKPKKVEPTQEEKDEILARKNLNPYERKKIEMLKELKEKVDKSGEEGVAFFTIAKDMGFPITDTNAMSKTGVVTRRRSSINNKRFVYKWEAGEPDSKLLQRIQKNAREIERERARAHALKKKKRKEEEEEAARILERNRKAERELESRKLAEKRKLKQSSFKSQGTVLDDETANSLRAKMNGLNPDDIEKLTKKEPQEIKPNQHTQKPDIPIEVSVTTEGNKKTVSIKIEV